MGKNPRAYKSEKRNRELSLQKKREEKRLQRLNRAKEEEASQQAEAAGTAVVEGSEKVDPSGQ